MVVSSLLRLFSNTTRRISGTYSAKFCCVFVILQRWVRQQAINQALLYLHRLPEFVSHTLQRQQLNRACLSSGSSPISICWERTPALSSTEHMNICFWSSCEMSTLSCKSIAAYSGKPTGTLWLATSILYCVPLLESKNRDKASLIPQYRRSHFPPGCCCGYFGSIHEPPHFFQHRQCRRTWAVVLQFDHRAVVHLDGYHLRIRLREVNNQRVVGHHAVQVCIQRVAKSTTPLKALLPLGESDQPPSSERRSSSVITSLASPFGAPRDTGESRK